MTTLLQAIAASVLSLGLLGLMALVVEDNAKGAKEKWIAFMLCSLLAAFFLALAWGDFGYTRAMLDHGYKWSEPSNGNWVKK